MLTATVDFKRFDASVRRTLTAKARILRAGVLAGARAGANHARHHHPHKRRTGRLTSRQHLYAVLDQAGRNSAKASFVNDAPYARFVEYPTRPHIIRPKAGHGVIGPLRRGQSRRAVTDIGTHRVALRFFVGGKTVFRAKVKHPGTPGFPFMRPALRVGADAAEKVLRIGIQKIAKDIWR
jgi:hypothetical protein